MKKRPFFRLRLSSLFSALLIAVFCIYGIPEILKLTHLDAVEPIAQLCRPAVCRFFGLFWALVHVLRHGLRSGFVRFVLLVCSLAVTFTYVYENWTLPLSDILVQKKVQAAPFVPDLEESTYVIRQEGLPPVAVLAGLGTEGLADRLDDAIFSLPDWLLNQAQVIYVMEDGRFEQELAAREIVSSDLVAGFSNYSYTELADGSRISNEDASVYLRLGSLDRETAAHELTHCFDFAMDITQKNNDSVYSQRVQEIYARNPYAISLYGSQSLSEFFAEAGSLYVTDPAALQNRSPEMFQIFSGLYPSTSSS